MTDHLSDHNRPHRDNLLNHRDMLRHVRRVVIDCARSATHILREDFLDPDHVGRGYICADCEYFGVPEIVGSHLGGCAPPPDSNGIDAEYTTADVEPACHRFKLKERRDP